MHVPIPREQQNIALALVIALCMVVIDIFIEGPSQRTLALVPHVGTILPLNDVRTAHEMLAGAPPKRGKIVLEV